MFPLHVLVIDDDADTRLNLSDILELDAYRVETAGTATEALARHNWEQLDAIILDRKLPDGTAEELLPHLRRLAPQAAVIVVTGYADVQGAVAALRLGAADYILKPVDPGELRARLGRIAEHRRTEQELQEQARILRSVLETINDAVMVVDERGRVQLFNPAVERIIGPVAVGAEPERWPQRGAAYLEDATTPCPPSELALARALRGQEVTDAEELLRRPGRAPGHWVSASASPLRDEKGNAQGAVVVWRDISERKRAEEAVRHERDFAESLIDTAQAIVLLLDPQGRIVRFNKFFEELAGYRLAEVQGKDWFDLFLPERDRKATRELFQRAAGGEPTRGNVNALVTREGTEREISWWDKTLKDPQGATLGLLAIGHDVSELKRAQERVLQSERLAAIGQMVTGLAHESGNALARSQSCLEMLAWEVEDRPEALRLIERIQKAQDHLAQLYQEVRGYAAPLKLERDEWNLSAVWRQAWDNLALLRQGRDAALSEEPSGTDLLCQVDPFRMEQVFRNILENSLAACSDPVRIVVRCGAAELDGHPAVRASVRDNGPGLGPEQRQRIFDPFFTTKTKGTGLGMAIVKRIVEAHGGRIAVGPPPAAADTAGGAEIVITLPREPL
jgi:PAS domain S-box-containing protein